MLTTGSPLEGLLLAAIVFSPAHKHLQPIEYLWLKGGKLKNLILQGRVGTRRESPRPKISL